MKVKIKTELYSALTKTILCAKESTGTIKAGTTNYLMRSGGQLGLCIYKLRLP